MYILDTDHLTLLERRGNEADKILERLRQTSETTFYTTIATYEEQTRGWFSHLAQAKNLESQIRAYQKLKRHLNIFCMMPIIDFDENAGIIFQKLQKSRLRIGTMDLKIAAITLSKDAVLLTRNFSDFSQIENLKIENWSN